MLSHPKPATYTPTKTTATHAHLPHVPSTLASLPDQKPSKNKPWSSLLAQQLNHRVDLVLPEESFAAVERALGDVVPPAHWRVVAPLGVFLDGAFFLELVKTGRSPLAVGVGIVIERLRRRFWCWRGADGMQARS